MNTITMDTKSRIEVLREMLREGTAGTQEEICEALKRRKFVVTQSTVSRDLRRIGAVKAIDSQGETIYRLPEEEYNAPLAVSGGLSGLLRSINHNDSMIVLLTSPGSASLVARHLDAIKTSGILGTLAGDDTIFVAPASTRQIPHIIQVIRQEFLFE